MTASDSSEPAPPVRHFRVFDGTLAILEFSDQPGALRSTAPPPPDGQSVQHPFVTATALEAGHEDQLKRLLDGATNVEQFIAALEGAGFRVVPD